MSDARERAAAQLPRLTVQGWQYLVMSIMGLVVLVGSLAIAELVHRTNQATDEVIELIQPSRVTAYQLQAALRDQETAVRGYVLSADEQFLMPFEDGRQTEAAASAQLRLLQQDRPDLLEDLDAIELAAGAWRTNFAQPAIEDVQPGRPTVISPELTDVGKNEFDRLRELFQIQNTRLDQAREDGIAEFEQTRWWRNVVMLAMLVAFVVTLALLTLLVRRTLVRPLSAVATACRRVAEGNFSERIEPQGPKDIRAIATDVENMRQRIVEELEASREANDALDEHAEELRRSNAELEQFAYVASHDLQEPLRKVASFCQLLEKRYGDKLDERGVEYIGFAVDGAKRMQVLINDLLTFSRVGRLNATETDVDLNATLDAALGNLATSLEESGAVIERPREGLPTVKGDPTLLTMLWQNLVGNAVKFRQPDVAPRVVIECLETSEDGHQHWSFSLADNGIGIAPEFSDKVFVIFQRLHGRDAYSGTGIGLALCKKIVEHHGGTIWIDNGYTGGTRFEFTLPVAVDDTAAPVLEGSTP
ncbi:histidine kinase [Mycolicibacterium duvalii]|uniref:histidine kinase n=1 Tax=Mycolicibacterium duvalii TaxID=39688 RepID=A0A7I7JWW8_9MYCO|nr:sensor histidine kinase [Mycolicibacterium duvalii]MCV7369603.1 CHASE3 domain-containing protein [Mycolicibacterium duvalii]PEG42225.1 histidine kinase [Mycolicibacterium duvalii]BBX16330.1 histidine kinase [Mycolicibacterium duvalii]